MNIEEVLQKLAECRDTANRAMDNLRKWELSLAETEERIDEISKQNALIKLGIDNATMKHLDERTYGHNNIEIKSLKQASLRYRSLVDEAKSQLSHYKRIERELVEQQKLEASKRKRKVEKHLRSIVKDNYIEEAREAIARYLVNWGMENNIQPSASMLPSLVCRQLEKDTSMLLSKRVIKLWEEMQQEATTIIRKEEEVE